jgi:hypothetical protein
MSQATNTRAAKLKGARFVSGEFHSSRCTLADFLIDIKVFQLEPVIVIHSDHDQPDSLALLDPQRARAEFVFSERHLNFMNTLLRRSLIFICLSNRCRQCYGQQRELYQYDLQLIQVAFLSLELRHSLETTEGVIFLFPNAISHSAIALG